MPAKKKTKFNPKKRKASTLASRVSALEKSIEHKELAYVTEIAADDSQAEVTKPYSTVGTVQKLLAGFSQGPGPINSFTGSRITWSKLWIRYCNSFVGENPNYRTALVWDKEDGDCVYDDIFRNDALAQAEKPLAGLNLSNRDRFVVLYDSINSMHPKSQMQLSVGADDTGFTEVVRDTGEGYIDLSGKHTIFNLTTGQEDTGALLLVTCANTIAKNTVPGGAPTVTAVGRFACINIRGRYTDA